MSVYKHPAARCLRTARGERWASTLKSARNVQLNPSSALKHTFIPLQSVITSKLRFKMH